MAVPQYSATITTHLQRIRTIPHPSVGAIHESPAAAPPKNQPEAVGFGLFSFYWLCSPSGLGVSLSSILVRAFSMDA